jgi:nucleotide-binding universal stress UspA family protein
LIKKKRKRRVGMESIIFRKIMIATDGSELVKRAVDVAIEIAKLSEAKMYAVHVIALEGNSIIHSRDEELKKALREQLTTEGKKATDYVENIGRTANVEVESIILEGNPANEILDFAERNDVDLIVMGTHGKTGFERFLIGSVSENVVRHSERAVLVVRGESADLLFKALSK